MKPHLRVQDAVASIARVSLKDTVKVLRTLPLVLRTLNEPGAASRLEALLRDSTRDGCDRFPLHEKPSVDNAEACYDFQNLMMEKCGREALEAISNLRDDPYCS